MQLTELSGVAPALLRHLLHLQAAPRNLVNGLADFDFIKGKKSLSSIESSTIAHFLSRE